MIPVLTPAQCRAWDEAAAQAGRPLRMLMETAGRAVARVALEDHLQSVRDGVLVACGPGNNGGDGWVAARALHLLGVPVSVVEVAEPGEGIAAEARQTALDDGVPTVVHDGPWPGVGLVIDALLGTGATGAPRPPIDALLGRLASLHRPVLAVDGPTGLDLATGTDHGALRADATVTFGGVRRGHLRARDLIGDLTVAEIGFPAPAPDWPRLVDRRWAASQLPGFASDAHKGDRGRVVIVGGSAGMTGAARLAARAAFATGAGLVYVVTPPDAAGDLGTAEPDMQVRAHPFDGAPSDELRELVERADAVVIGPGLGRGDGRAAFVLALLEHAACAVLDADALTVLAESRDALHRAAARRPIILTPHPGEFRTLFAEHAGLASEDPWQAAANASMNSEATVLLKGVPTVIASAGAPLLTVAAGNPGLASGGSGDVLSGIIGAMLAAGVAPLVAAAIGAQALGDAADLAAMQHGARGMRPMDVIAALAETWVGWREASDRHPAWLGRLPRPAAA